MVRAMRVLLLEFDLYKTVGGGQTVYRRLIETNPQIEFTYFAKDEALDARRPRNARAVAFQPRQFFYDPNVSFATLEYPNWMWHQYFSSYELAQSVAGEAFDIIEFADYHQFGAFIRQTFEAAGVKFQKVVQSMHGSCSTTHQMDWGMEHSTDVVAHTMEQWQFRAADIRYAISRDYREEWQHISSLPIHYLDPRAFLDFPKPHQQWEMSGLPQLVFIGRPEKRKGPDIFLELVRALPRHLYSRAAMIGPSYNMAMGVHSDQLLRDEIRASGVPVELLPPMSPAELQQLFAQRTVVLLPSRYDTLNLLAVESLFSGCPTLIGDGAGACRYLDDIAPQVPYEKIQTSSPHSVRPALQQILENYDGYRTAILQGLNAGQAPIDPQRLPQIYDAAPAPDPLLRPMLERYHEILAEYAELGANPRRFRMRVTGLRLSGIARNHYRRTTDASQQFLSDVYQLFHTHPERSEREITQKLGSYWQLADATKVDRVRIWNELGRLEHLRGDRVLSTTYRLRSMRLVGHDRWNDTPEVVRALEQNNYPIEARAALAMYGSGIDNRRESSRFIESTAHRHRDFETCRFVEMEDHRQPQTPRVSVIVSLYNAAAKLPRFLFAISEQTLLREHALEFIFVDSNSPGDEGRVLREFIAKLRLPALYVRTERRETIQTAWNRGIKLARAPYVAFLGVDETVAPHCYATLADELDRDPQLDWVTGNSVVTEVDSNGNHVRDLMTYDRSPYEQDLVYLETCFLSWVGALYRKSIHARFGFYDGTFRAAGDTEFKSRVMPYIRSKALPVLLGTFWNYPDERTTAGPLAELEDLRAWYLHRTAAGADYAHRDKPIDEVERLLRHCLGYRKSYIPRSGHMSTDIDYAVALLRHLETRPEPSRMLPILPGLLDLQASYRALEYVSPFAPFAADRQLGITQRTCKRVRDLVRTQLGGLEPAFNIFNDNRYEQHQWPWRFEKTEFGNKRGERYVWL